MRAHSSLTASASAWWPPPLPACGGWTGSAGALAGGVAGGLAARCVRRAGCPGGRARARHSGSLGRNCSHCWGPKRRPPRCLEHRLPHCSTKTHTEHTDLVRWVIFLRADIALCVSSKEHVTDGKRELWYCWQGINTSERIYSSSPSAACYTNSLHKAETTSGHPTQQLQLDQKKWKACE